MKTYIKRYLLWSAIGVMMAGALSMTSCKMDDPDPIPAEELYLRAFIKKYGLIDPQQDWNQAERSEVTVRVDHAKQINVFVNIAGYYYRVAMYVDVTGTVTIPVDVPEGTKTLYVMADDEFRQVEVNGTADFTARSKAPSRATDYSNNLSRHVWWNEGLGIQRYSVELPDDKDKAINVTTMIYAENVYNGSTLETIGAALTGLNGGTTHFAMNQGEKAYFQIHTAAAQPGMAYLLHFETVASSPATLYIKTDTDVAVSETIELDGNESHNIIIPWIGTDKYPQVGFYLAEGSIESIGNIMISEFNPANLAWLMVAEDLGATDDFDFNDVIIRISAMTSNVASVTVQNEYWQVIQDEDTHLVLGAPARADGDDAEGENYTHLCVQAMCAGGILDSYLHFRTSEASGSKDFVLAPGMGTATTPIDLTTTSNSGYSGSASAEWHTWFENAPEGAPNNRPMLNTGINNGYAGGKAYIVVEGEFSLTQYSTIFQDYDNTPDQFDNGNYKQNLNLTGWSYGCEAGSHIYGFYITVMGYDQATCEAANGRTLGQPKAGAAPQMFLIPDVNALGLWRWPMERVPITSAYPDFANWVTTASSSTDWFVTAPKMGDTQTVEGDTRPNSTYPRD